MKKVKNKRLIYVISIITIAFIISNLLVRNTSILNFKMLDSSNLFTYFGVLIGFALTIYTFGLAMISDIKKDLLQLKGFTKDEKSDMLIRLVNGFNEVKEDIWIIFISLILIIFFAIAKEIPNPFSFKVEKYLIPESSNLTLFTMTTYAMFDILRTLFNLSEIKLELLKKNNNEDSIN